MLGRARLKIDFRKKLLGVLFLVTICCSANSQEISTEEYNPNDNSSVETTSNVGGASATVEKASETNYEIKDSVGSGAGLVEIVYPAEILAPYKDRRPDHQFVFHFQYENFKPTGFSQVIASSASVLGLNLGYKYNLPVVGLELSGFFGSGGASGGVDRTSYSVQKKGLRLAAIFDGILDEPYVAPYLGLQIVKWDVSSTSDFGTFSASPDFVMGTQVGLLFQLNWLEPKTALRALNEDGLNNSYLDLFFQQYGATSGIDLASSFNWGAGFRLEY